MASTSETGHGKNAANFHTLLTGIIITMGDRYNPVRESISITSLKAQDEALGEDARSLRQALTDASETGNVRVRNFNAINPLLTRIGGAIRLAAPSPETLIDAEGYIAKLRGTRRGKLPEAPEAGSPAAAEGEGPDTISVSQQSFDRKVDHFKDLVALIGRLPRYASNDPALSLEGLRQTSLDLDTINHEAKAANALVIKQRIRRDNGLYAPQTGVLDTVAAIKDYLISLPGGRSNPYYQQATKLTFKRPRK